MKIISHFILENMSDPLLTGYPSALNYKIKKMASTLSRISVKILPDRSSSINPNDILSVKLPSNSLVDLKTFLMNYQFSTSGTTGTFQAPKYSSSIINRIVVSINGQVIDVVNDYAYLYHLLMSLESGAEQISKRNISENWDPTLKYTSSDPSSAADVAIAYDNWFKTGASAQSKQEFTISNWCNFINTCSTTIINTGLLGDVVFQFYLSNSYILPATINATAQTLAGGSYTLDNVYFTVDVISFGENDYYELLASKLVNGLTIGFTSYLNARFASVTKSSGISVNWNVSANSLNQIICTLPREDQNSAWKPLIIYGANDAGSTVYNLQQLIADPAKVNNTGTIRTENLGDAFGNSYYFISSGAAIKDSKISLNNRAISYGALSPKEIFFATSKALGYNNLDLSSGISPCIQSLQHFCKYWFCHIEDLTIQDKDFYIGGINSIGSTVTISWDATFNGSSNSQKCVPMIYAQTTKLLEIYQGRQIQVIN